MEERPRSPLLLIVSSPSGAGKTTLTNALRARVGGVNFSVSHTTRKPRASEQHGREYYFVDRAEFQRLIEADAFLEWALVHGNFYGTSRSEVARAGGCRALLFDVDYQGARQIRCAEPDAVTVFILPPDMPTLERRLRGRASEDESAVQRRFQAAKDEIAHYGFFDYVLVNDDLERAIQQLISVLLAEECRRKRGAPRAEQLLNDVRGFGGTRPPR
ncbi:MAG TPA: guanylate kinase [Polyangiaceae bacterium]|nr:guanylate kinase [Polyangiaceae bacterium]